MLTSHQPMFMAWGRRMTWLYNDAFVPILGQKLPQALGMAASELWSEAWDQLGPLFDQVYRGSPVQMDDISLMLDRNGAMEEAHFSFSYNPAYDAEGRVVGLFGVCTETTAQVMAQRQLRRSEERLEMALSAGNSIGTWDWDVLNDRVTADARFAELYGVSAARAARGAPIAEFFAGVQPEDLPRLRMEVDAALKSGEPFASEYRLVSPDGSVKWVAAQGQATLDVAGKAVRFPGVSFDITARKIAEAQQTMLRGELQHRNKNLMAMISAIGVQTLRGEDIRGRRDAFAARLAALARAQDILIEGAGTGASVRAVVQGTTAHQGEGRFVLQGPEILLSPRQAFSLSLATHELSTNSVKYGALSVPGGRVAVTWSITQDDATRKPMFQWTWAEQFGPIVETPKESGFGSKLLSRVLPADFEGTVSIDYAPQGVRVVLAAPLHGMMIQNQ